MLLKHAYTDQSVSMIPILFRHRLGFLIAKA